MDSREIAVERVAAGQRGRFTRAQVREIVGDPQRARNLTTRRLRSGRWRRLSSRVLMLPGAPQGNLESIWTAHLHLGTDSVVSHMSAASLWKFPGVPPGRLELLVPRGSNRRFEGATVYQRGDLTPLDVAAIDGLAVTTVSRTLADLSPAVSRPRMDMLVDHALLERLTTPRALTAQLEHLRRRGKSIGTFADCLAERLPGVATESSVLERELTALLERAGIPAGIAQHPAPGRPGDREGLVDRAWPDLRWVVEADGRRWHAREAAMAIDRARDRNAQAAGWLVTRLTYDDLVRRRDATAMDLAAVHSQRVSDLHSRERHAG
jgi:hypothetical protein